MAFDEFDYSRKWTDPADFPTYEYDEGTVRDDMQALFDEIRDAFNDFATQADTDITELQGAIDDIEAGQVPDGSIDDHKLAPNSVTSAHIVNGTIKSEDIMDGTIEAKKLAEKSVPGSGISGVTSRIRAGSIAAADIKNKTITPAKLADGGTSSAGIPGSGIAGVVSKIRQKSIGPGDLVDGGVGKGIPGSGLEPVVKSKIQQQSIGTLDIVDRAITNPLIEDNAVTPDKINMELLSEYYEENPIPKEQIAIGAVSWVYPEILEVNDWQAVTITTYVNQAPYTQVSTGGQGEGQISIGGQSTTITYYVLEISEPTIKATDRPIVDVSLPLYSRDAAEEKMDEWSKVAKVETSNGKIIFSAYEKPNTDFGVNVLVLRR